MTVDGPGARPNYWLVVPGVIAAAVAVGLAAYFLETGGTTAAVTATSTATACRSGQTLEHLAVGSMSKECVEPTRHPSRPRGKRFSYFAWRFALHGRTVRLVVVGAPLRRKPVTARVTPHAGVAARPGSKLAAVDLFDNGARKAHYASRGRVTLDPNGAVGFHDVAVRFRGERLLLNGGLTP